MTNSFLRMSGLKGLLAGAALLAATATGANAISLSVKRACASDYFAHCSQHAVGSPGVRQCMSAVGPKLSKSCVSALVAAGEVGKAQISARRASLR